MLKDRTAQLWLALLSTSIALEIAALYFQYVLDYGPCILCVQIRAVLFVVILLAALALLLPVARKLTTVLLTPCTLTFAWFCYQVLGIERGWFEGSCTFEPAFPAWIPLHEWLPSVFEPWEERGWFEGSCTFEPAFPAWIPLHEWLPSVFEPWELCGYTPDILLGITMAETLVGLAGLFLIANIFLLKDFRRQ